MIRTHVNNINPDKYIYKTNLKFGEEVCRRILEKVKAEQDVLVHRSNYDSPAQNPLETYKLIGAAQSRELIRRGRQINEKYPNQKQIQFNQYFLQPTYAEEFLSITPDFLKNITAGEPVPIFQISQAGDILPPHKGHKRKSSLFMLLEGNNEETRWYRETEPFEIVPSTRIPDLDKIEQVVSAQIEPGFWYVFNHLEWHSVHKFGNNLRMNIGLDFDSITAEQLVNIIKTHQGI